MTWPCTVSHGRRTWPVGSRRTLLSHHPKDQTTDQTHRNYPSAAAALGTSATAGQQIAIDKGYTPPEPEAWFAAGEFQLDLFGQYTDGNGPNHAGPIASTLGVAASA
jgi:hypothetical protein